MKKLLIMLLLSLTVTGCIVAPGRGYDDRGWERRDHHESHEDRDHHGTWGR